MNNKAKQSVKSFLDAWKHGDHKAMHGHCQKTYCIAHTHQNVRALFPEDLTSYELGTAKKASDVMYDVRAKLTIGDRKVRAVIRTICEARPWVPSVDGDFGVNPISISRMLH